MFFFISRKQLEVRINNCVNKIIEQYGIDEIESKVNSICSEFNSFKKDVNKTVNTISNQGQQLNGELVRVSNDINNCREELRELARDRVSVDEDVHTRIIQSELEKRLSDIKKDLSTEIMRKLPDRTLDENDIRAIVRTELQNSQQSQGKEQLWAEINAYVSQAVSVYQSGIQAELERQNRDIDNLKNSLQRESLKNSEYEKRILNQEKEISVLSDTIREMKSAIEKLSISDEPGTPPLEYIVFGSDKESNNKYLENLINQTKVLRKKVTEVFDDSQDLNLYLKLINKCISKVEQLLSKNQEGDVEPDKLANDCAKIYKQTIVKAMSQEKLKELLKEYMRDCHFRKLEWYIGKKISGDDFDYLEEPILYEEVEDKALDSTIRDIKQDTYIIGYMDEGEKYEVIIPGIYCLGKSRK